MNYFSYFSEIEDTFIRRRGKHLMLSPIDWALIESWKERGVPLHLAVRAIEHAFDSYESKKHKRTVKTLLYCQEEVESQYAEWLESRVGSHDGEQSEGQGEEKKSPFSKKVVLSHLDTSLGELQRLIAGEANEENELTESCARAAGLLADIRDEYANAVRPDTRKLEESLSGIDRMLDDAMRTSVSTSDLTRFESEVDEQVKPYRRHMEKEVFAQTRENLLKKRLREHFDVPRMSLFFLHA